MNMRNSIGLLLFMGLLSYGLSANGQDTAKSLALDDAIAVALEYNYDVKVAGLSLEVAQNLAEAGNAGLLPSVYLDGSGSYQLANTEVQFSNPEIPPIVADGAQTINLAADALLTYTLLDGGRRVNSLRLLESQSEDARLREKLAMENTSIQVASRFLEALRLGDAVAISLESVVLSLERSQRAEENYQYGIFTRLQLLNAEVDLRADSIILAEAELEYAQAKRDLYFLMGLPADTSLVIDSVLVFLDGLDRGSLINGAQTRNTSYLRARNEVYGAAQNLKVSKGDLYPTLNFQGGYRYSFNDFEANFLDRQEQAGWNAGLSMRFYLFDGGRVRRNIENARLNMAMAEVEESRALNEIVALIGNAWDSYLTSRKLLDLSTRNLALAQANYARSREAFATGQITGTELRDAQINLTRTRNEISVRRIRSKLAEVGLLFEAGVLLE
jgi:outer membrane protein TolC